jgi:hypothetical protein
MISLTVIPKNSSVVCIFLTLLINVTLITLFISLFMLTGVFMYNEETSVHFTRDG